MKREKRNDGRMTGEGRGAPLLTGLLIGGLVGAGTMLLLAPQAGSRTRLEIREGAIDLSDRTTDKVRGAASEVKSRADQIASGVRKKADELQSQGKDIAIEQLDRVTSAAQAGKRAIQDSKNT
jgi:gas vesicle protein